ncbi:MAG: hypothetical protein HY748_18410 [Elusimicrobia bacterium]|nr:hypothetical protein [Elusimicrobiota bacterium]
MVRPAGFLLGSGLAMISIALDCGAVETPPEPAAHWSKQGSSLVLYDSSGTIVHEVPLGLWEEASGAQVQSTQTLGGTVAGGRFAWTLEKTTAWNASKTKTLKADRVLHYYGTTAGGLWSLALADAPPDADPLVASASGETVAVAVNTEGEWTVLVRTFLGNPQWEMTGLKSLSSAFLTPNGKYALIRWSEPDKSATHTFVEVATKARKDIASEDFVLGPARLTDDGKVFAGERLLYEFKQGARK